LIKISALLVLSQRSSRLDHVLQDATSSPNSSLSASPKKHASASCRCSDVADSCYSLVAKGSQGPVTATTLATGGGNGQDWVNSATHVYHEEGSRFYGKAKHGKYMSGQHAIKEGDLAAKNEH
jgi:hypothetical protein